MKVNERKYIRERNYTKVISQNDNLDALRAAATDRDIQELRKP